MRDVGGCPRAPAFFCVRKSDLSGLRRRRRRFKGWTPSGSLEGLSRLNRTAKTTENALRPRPRAQRRPRPRLRRGGLALAGVAVAYGARRQTVAGLAPRSLRERGTGKHSRETHGRDTDKGVGEVSGPTGPRAAQARFGHCGHWVTKVVTKLKPLVDVVVFVVLVIWSQEME